MKKSFSRSEMWAAAVKNKFFCRGELWSRERADRKSQLLAINRLGKRFIQSTPNFRYSVLALSIIESNFFPKEFINYIFDSNSPEKLVTDR